MPRFALPTVPLHLAFSRSTEDRPVGLAGSRKGGRREAPLGRRARWLAAAAALALFGVVGVSWGIRTFPAFGPWVADSLRATVGSQRVTQLEELVAGVEDRLHSATSNGQARSLEEALPEPSVAPQSVPVSVVASAAVAVASAVPTDVGPQHDDLKARGDGIWQAVGTRDGGVPSIHRMLLHPDRERSYAELFVFALDLSQLELHAQAGSVEPRRQDDSGETPAGSRPGVVPEEARGRLVAAFNGGFKAEHGHYGMMTNGTEWLGPKKGACTFARMASGELRVATWSALANEKDMSWWRQTPACMVEDGALHAGLRTEGSKGWGATLEGDTVIRRSAVGVTADGKFLLVGISNSTTATALARGMMHAGARQVAQLDVNFSYPRFLLYRDAAATTHAMRAEGAVKGLLYSEDEYLGRASGRDFFYVTHK